MIGLRLLAAASAAVLSAAGFAAPLYLPRDKPADTERAAILHEAHAVGLRAIPGRVPAPQRQMQFVAAAAPAAPTRALIWQNGRLVDLRGSALTRAPETAQRVAVPGGVNALLPIAGVMTDVGNVAATSLYGGGQVAADLQVVPMRVASAAGVADIAKGDAPRAWSALPQVLALAGLMLLAGALMLVLARVARRAPVRLAATSKLLPARALPPVRRQVRPAREPRPGVEPARRRRA